MRPFRKFFLLSLGFFLFLFFAKFLVLAFIAAAVFTFISSVVGKIRQASYYGDYHSSYNRQWLPKAGADYMQVNDPLVEPLINSEFTENRWSEDHRSIKVY